jgi:hypothetical protein
MPRKAENRIQLNRIALDASRMRKRGTVPSRGGFAFRSETPALTNESPSETGLYPFSGRLLARQKPFDLRRNGLHPEQTGLCPARMKLESRQMKPYPWRMNFNPPRINLHPRQMKLDLQQMKLDLRRMKASGPCPGGVL